MQSIPPLNATLICVLSGLAYVSENSRKHFGLETLFSMNIVRCQKYDFLIIFKAKKLETYEIKKN